MQACCSDSDEALLLRVAHLARKYARETVATDAANDVVLEVIERRRAA